MDSGRARRRDARRPIGAAGVVTPGHAMTSGVDERPGVVWLEPQPRVKKNTYLIPNTGQENS